MKKKQRRLPMYVFFLLCIIGVCYKIKLISTQTIEHAISYCVYPALLMQQRVVSPVKNFFMTRKKIEDLERTIKELQDERNTLIADNVCLQACLDYVHDIKELVEFKQQYEDKNARLVHIISKNISEQSHFFIIDAGSNRGIKKNMIAIYQNGLIGRVQEVYPLYSKVMLITDKACKVAARCTKTHTEGIFEGCNEEDKAHLSRVSHLSTLENNDLVISTGQGLVFPQGFGLGHIRKYERDLITYNVEIEPLFDFHSLNYCFLIESKSSC